MLRISNFSCLYSCTCHTLYGYISVQSSKYFIFQACIVLVVTSETWSGFCTCCSGIVHPSAIDIMPQNITGSLNFTGDMQKRTERKCYSMTEGIKKATIHLSHCVRKLLVTQMCVPTFSKILDSHKQQPWPQQFVLAHLFSHRSVHLLLHPGIHAHKTTVPCMQPQKMEKQQQTKNTTQAQAVWIKHRLNQAQTDRNKTCNLWKQSQIFVFSLHTIHID